MVESAEEYVLQWDAHAKYVTERFSGLFARQAFVDVTLICDEQKLRVHKLVLASSSLYFEEMLQQDLGQEPVIFLDLNFEILKAMVEFMYCGETTIAHQFLPSLLEAAITFKVKELACMVEKTIRPQDTTLECDFYDQELSEEELFEMGCITRTLEDEAKSSTEESNNNHSIFLNENSESNSDKGASTEANVASDQELDALYDSMDTNSKDDCESVFEDRVNGDSSNNNNYCLFSEDAMKLNSPQESPASEGVKEENMESFEKCCSMTNNDCDFSNQVGQCLRVYTRKRRDQSKLPDVRVVNPTPDCSPSCINLNESLSSEATPVTLPLLDSCLSDYIIEDEFGLLKAENSDSNPSTTSRDTFEDDSPFERSSLRRSERISQQDDFPHKKSSTKRRRKHLDGTGLGFNGVSHPKRSKRQSQKAKRKEDKFSKIADAASDNASNCSLAPPRCSVTATSIDRALWGDMSDVKDFEDNGSWLDYYEEGAQIPFAVGLLPLRAALERMQAMPEHQPRKTRSSVAPGRDIFSRRRYVFHRMNLKETVHKNEAGRENANAVCHIQISTQYRNRKLENNVRTLAGTASVSDKH